MTLLSTKMNSSTVYSCPDCSAFLNWNEDISDSEHERAPVFRSLVAIVKLQPALDASLEGKAVRFLTFVSSQGQRAADAFLYSFRRTADRSLTDFTQSIVVLISSPNPVITIVAMKMVDCLIWNCSAKVRLSLIKADLVPQVINSLTPQSLPLPEAVDIHISVLETILSSIWLTTPDGLTQLKIEDENEQQAVHETVLKQVVTPSEKLLRICPYYQPTINFVLHMPLDRMEQYPGHEPSAALVEADKDQRTLRAVSGSSWTTNPVCV
ncbi:hypothetical protein BLNAU_10753 [Blattamonas nauphoetae]|uniref:Uncharacterized protein n=1 Tax=Blattamonas nauphoetae TaxID=2049346 RepID=A0ABQ9XRE4_9EUKA|nr:hypothetical protein BLNAU_10753 [Blattamonas nauphoetae]